jgi:glycosyltransferase involved in cell wall biosynthesis
MITCNEEANVARTLESVLPLVSDGQGEIIVVDSGSTDRTVEIANLFGARVFVEAWKGYAPQKNSAIEKATGDWILSLDADEELDPNAIRVIPLVTSKLDDISDVELGVLVTGPGEGSLGRVEDRVEMVTAYEEAGDEGKAERDTTPALSGYWIVRKNEFLGRWIKHGVFWPDRKLRLFRRGCGRFEDRAEVCPEFCVNDRVLFSGMGRWGRGHFPFPSPSL